MVLWRQEGRQLLQKKTKYSSSTRFQSVWEKCVLCSLLALKAAQENEGVEQNVCPHNFCRHT